MKASKKTGRLLSQAELGLAVFASKEAHKPNLNTIHVTNDYTEATDGHFACRVAKDNMDPDEFPVIENTGSDFEGKIDVCIPTEVLKGLKAPKKVSLPIFTYAKLTTGEKQHYLTSTDLTSTSITPIQKNDMEYPKVDQVLPNISNGIQIGLNVDLLGTIVGYAKKYGAKAVMFTIPKNFDNTTPVEFEAKLSNSGLGSQDGQTAKGIIMPFRI
jgi:hypothetical protein